MKKILCLISLSFFLFVWSCQNQQPNAPQQKIDLESLKAKLVEINTQLAKPNNPVSQRLGKTGGGQIQIAAIYGLTPFDNERFEVVLVPSPFRWVAGDPRREPDGTNITYLVDRSAGGTDDGLGNAQTEPVMDQSMGAIHRKLQRLSDNLSVVKRRDPGGDVTIFDSFFGLGGFGDFLAADIVDAGFFPGSFFATIFGPGGSNVLAFSITFIWVSDGVPTDVDGNGFLDTALNEVYFNDQFTWAIDDDFDIATVATHEYMHSFGMGHVGPPPVSLMNPSYFPRGIWQRLDPAVQANLRAIYKTWPNP
ncbi:MAG: hypothetical protein ACE5HO_08985 [bacterium]